ncbi:helix-turn-helix domain-containing protein [Pseudarthrobacter sp. NPDC089323]
MVLNELARWSEMGTRQARYANGVATRKRIIDAALEELKQKGYARASLREVANQAGVTPAGVNHYFRTKEDLFLEVLRLRDEQHADAETKTHTQPLAELLEVVADNRREPDLVRLFVAMSAEAVEPGSPANTWFVARYQTLLGDLENDVRGYQDRGEIRRDISASDIASLMVAAADGLQTQWLLNPTVDMGGRLRTLWLSFGQPKP